MTKCLFCFSTVSFIDCRKAALPFLCQYYFPLKDCTTDNIYTASKEDCIRISTTVCATPWNIAVTLGHGHRLPKCNTLPHGEHRIVEHFAKEIIKYSLVVVINMY